MSDFLTLSLTAPNGIADISDADLAQKLRSVFDRLTSNADEWIECSLELGALLLQGRDKFGSNTAFGSWLARNELNFLNKNDQAAIIEMARDPERFRIVLEETDRRSYQTIQKYEFGFPNVRKTETAETAPVEPLPEPEKSSEVEQIPLVCEEVVEPRRPTERAELQISSEDEDAGQADPPSTKGRTSRQPKTSKHRLATLGESGRFLDEWVTRTIPPGRSAPIFAQLWLGTMPQAVIDAVAAFVRATPDLPSAWYGPKKPTPALFWREMPQQIVDSIVRRIPLLKPKTRDRTEDRSDYPAILLATIEAWPRTIAPVYAAWCTAGKPVDSRAWYVRHLGNRPVQVAVLARPSAPIDPEILASLPPHMAELLDDTRPYESHHEGFQPMREAPIRAYGADLWPRPPGTRWTFREAFYAFHLWNELQPLMKESRPAERARLLMNPVQPILQNIAGGFATALREILVAQFQHPEREADTTAPPKRLNTSE